jgi:hypothetical protein
MRSLRDAWSGNVIKGAFKGDVRAFAMSQFKAGATLVYLGRKVGSLLELMALPDNQLYIADEAVDAPDSSDSVANVLKQYEGKEVSTAILMEKLRAFSEPGSDILAKLYEEGRLDYRMDRTFVKPEKDVVPEMMTEVAPPAPAPSIVSKMAKVAGSRMAGESLFLQNVLTCPNCGSNMKTVKLVGSVDSWFCGNCRHCDFSDKVKSTSHANIQTVDKILEFRCLENGNCEIAN